MPTYQGGGHDGAVAFERDAEVTAGYDGNCSMRRKRGGLFGFFAGDALTPKTADANLGTCRSNKRRIEHHVYATRGIVPFGEGVHPGTGARTAAVDLRCLPDLALSSLKMMPVDGASL